MVGGLGCWVLYVCMVVHYRFVVFGSLGWFCLVAVWVCCGLVGFVKRFVGASWFEFWIWVEFVIVVGVGGCRFVLLWLGWRAFLGVFYGLQFGVF